MKIAICEDNASELDAIYGYIRNYCEKNSFLIDIHAYNSGEALLDAFLREKFDVIFMDIVMGGMSGIDVARKIRETALPCIILFTTVSEEYSLDAYSVDGAAYVLKPLDAGKMDRALEKCRREFMRNSRFITVPISRQGETRLPLAGIRYVEVYGRDVWFHADSDKIKTSRMTLDEVERALDGSPFLRCHRCYIVNMNYVDKLKNGVFLMKNGDSVPIRRRGYSEILSSFNEFIAKSDFWGDSI